MKFRKSRLQKIEEKKSLRQAIVFFTLTIILLLMVFFLGIPLVIKLAVYLGEKRSTARDIESSEQLLLTQPHLAPLLQATNSATLNLAGFASAGTKIRVYLNNNVIKEITANKDGEFSARNLTLAQGKNTIKVVSYEKDKESEPYTTNIVYKTSAPGLEIFSPKDDDSFFDEEDEIVIEGKTDPGAVIVVNQHLAIVDVQGNFQLRLSLKEGENLIKVVAEDEAGNKTEIEKKVTYTP